MTLPSGHKERLIVEFTAINEPFLNNTILIQFPKLANRFWGFDSSLRNLPAAAGNFMMKRQLATEFLIRPQ